MPIEGKEIAQLCLKGFVEHRLPPRGLDFSQGRCIRHFMPAVQSSLVPDTGKALRLKDARWAAPLTLQAFYRLIRARLAFSRLEARELPHRNAAAARAGAVGDAADELLADRIGFVIARLAKRLPWRSDCVIQAIAAQDWLAEHGMASEIRIGVERPEDGPFAAHAWLVRGERIITGGDISRYSLLQGMSPKISDL